MAFVNWLSLGVSPLPRPTGSLWRTIPPDPEEVKITGMGAADYAAWLFCVPESRIIQSVGFRITNLNQGASAQYRVSLQAVVPSGTGTAGIPSGTPLTGIGGAAQFDFYPTLGFNWYTLQHSYPATRGNFLAIVVQRIGGTIPGGGNGISVMTRFGEYAPSGDPYALQPAFSGDFYPGAYAIRYSDSGATSMYGNPMIGAYPVYSVEPNSVTAGVGERVPMRFNLPPILGNTFNVTGLRFQAGRIYGTIGQSSPQLRMGIWNSAGTLLESYDVRLGASFGDNPWGYRELYFAGSGSPPALNYGTTYYAGFEQLQANVTARLNLVEVRKRDNATHPYDNMDAYPGGKDVHSAKWRQIAGVWQWEAFEYVRPMIDLILSDTNV